VHQPRQQLLGLFAVVDAELFEGGFQQAPRRTRKRPEIRFAPREIFEQLLEWSVIPTFDLVVEVPDYVVRALNGDLVINTAHFSGHRVIKKHGEVPTGTGAMYRFYLSRYFDRQ
jgi:hypothetical protein